MPALKLAYLAIAFFFQVRMVFAQDTTLQMPKFQDKYSNYVKQLEEGKTEVDYTDFRHSFLESKQYSIKGTNYNDLKKKTYDAIKIRNYQNVISLTKQMLSIDYTSMFAHKYLQQTYKLLGDSLNFHKYHDIEFGLLNSIVKSGDGKSCETGWHVTQIEEEYFILNMLGAQLKTQSIANGGKNTCDKMEVKTEEGGSAIYFFEANKIFEMERKLFGGN